MTTGIAREPRTADPRYALTELMFFAYRDFVADADRILAGDGFGRAHHRVLYFVTRRPGLTVAELLEILRITKQSLNRVLKDLLDRGYMTNRLGEADRRQRRLEATPRGVALIEEIAAVQSARFARAFARMGVDAEAQAAAFLAAMMDDGGSAQRSGPPGSSRTSRLHSMAGEFKMPDDFDTMGQAKIEAMFGVGERSEE